ncbi:hypothetical protein PMAYCL1PPCAC_20757, partial [Pristionchus mayeri]
LCYPLRELNHRRMEEITDKNRHAKGEVIAINNDENSRNGQLNARMDKEEELAPSSTVCELLQKVAELQQENFYYSKKVKELEKRVSNLSTELAVERRKNLEFDETPILGGRIVKDTVPVPSVITMQQKVIESLEKVVELQRKFVGLLVKKRECDSQVDLLDCRTRPIGVWENNEILEGKPEVVDNSKR